MPSGAYPTGVALSPVSTPRPVDTRDVPPAVHGRGATLWRARIVLALGDRDQAIGLLRQAVNEGVSFSSLVYGDRFHVDVDLEPLFGYPPYEEIVAPKP